MRILGLTPIGRATAEALHFNRPAMTLLRHYWRRPAYSLASNRCRACAVHQGQGSKQWDTLYMLD